ncbi:hypothetical protein [Bdellovibrio reynosensis]|uniref:Lipoprotein n=1 Tax=Bdellovibrio reynosensis TaxID=2835041 RepID=A0ABY4CKD6_9BACT|nr:hypothetical protein [Bdellovibrio reynosensis]UOF02710.1 hypothetical protein MNR06_07075 [Bdellovibrio reynosensis]
MKTNILFGKVLKVAALLTMTVFLANCGKSNSGGTTATTVATTAISSTAGYAVSVRDNQCYQWQTSQYVAVACNNIPNGSYIIYNHMCQQVQNGSTTVASSQTACAIPTQVCTGQYFDSYGTTANCGSQMSCKGYTLYNSQGLPVRCQ